MEFKIYWLIMLLSATLASSSSIGYLGNKDIQIKSDGSSILAEDFGALLINVLKQVVAALPDPLVLLKAPEDDPNSGIEIDLTEATKNSDLKIKGKLKITHIEVDGLSGFNVERCSLVLNGIMSPLPFDIALGGAQLSIKVQYSVDALVAGLIPLRGAGLLAITCDDFGFGVNGSIIKAYAKMELGGLDLSVATSKVDVQLGDIGNPALGKSMGDFLAQLLQFSVLEPINQEDSSVDLLVEKFAKEIFDGMELTLDKLRQLLPKPFAFNVESLVNHAMNFNLNSSR